MIRLSARLASVLAFAALAALSLPVFRPLPSSRFRPRPRQEPSAPAPSAAPVFPKPDPANFTAASPTKEIVNAFLQTSWGFDDTRIWQVQAILKTPVEGISKVVVFVGDKTGKQKPAAIAVLCPSRRQAHHRRRRRLIPFGEHPYAEHRAQLQQRADGPYRGSA